MSNVISVKPRRRKITYQGLHGWIEFKPARKVWEFTLKLLYPVVKTGEKHKEEEAVLALKQQIDIVNKGNTKNVKSID